MHCSPTLNTCQPKRGDSITTWSRWKTGLQTAMPKALIAKTAEDLKRLSPPALVAANQGTENRVMRKEIAYRHCVGQLQRKNPDALLTKVAADSAFRLAANRLNSKNKGRDSAIARVRSNVHFPSVTALLIIRHRFWARKAPSTGRTDKTSPMSQ